MTQLDSTNHSLSLPYDTRSNDEAIRYLIVLVPVSDADLSSVTRKVWSLADSMGCHIMFLGICDDKMQEGRLRRTLTTISSMLNYDNVSAKTEVICGNDWVTILKSRCRPGDMVVCFDEQRSPLLQKPLQRVLRSDLDVPLYILTGFDSQSNSQFHWMAQVAMWTGFIVLILGFSLLQVKIILLDTDWTILLELLTAAAEFWLIMVWNKWFK